MADKNKIPSLFKNYFFYLSVFTVEVILVVAYFTWQNQRALISSALVDKYNIAEKYGEEYEALLSAFRSTIGHYYIMAGIVIFSVIIFALLIHILMKSRLKDIEKIKKLKAAEIKSEEIIHSEAKYRSLFENNGTAILVVGNDELISDCNEKFANIIDYSKEDLIGKMHWEKIVHTDDIDRVKEYDRLRRTGSSKAPGEYLMKMISRDGSFRQVIVTVIVLQGTEQLASIVDITEMIEKDRALKENQELFRQAQEIASIGSWSYSFDDKKLAVSEEFVSILDLHDIKGNITLESLRTELHFEQFYRAVAGMIRDLNGTDSEISYLETRTGADHKTFYFKLKGKVIKEDGKAQRIIGILQDITGRKMIENEMNRTNKDLKNLLYVASHDLQDPVISIEGFSKMLSESLKNKEIPSECNEYLERIIRNTKQVGQLFRNFFKMSGAGSTVKNFVNFSSYEMLEGVISDNKLLTEKYSAAVKTAPETDFPRVFGDRNNIRLLFHHLISNAVLYGAKNIYAGYNDEKGFFIKDDGRGIKIEYIEKVFLPGERLGESIIPGTGMGLPFCRKVADMHNGSIIAESDGENKGSVFYFMPSYELIRD